MNGRVAMVTGGGSGIGREICIGVANAGRKIAVADVNLDGARETVAQISSSGGEAIAVHVDVSDSDAVQQGVLQTVDELGSVDILVNCAGWDEMADRLKERYSSTASRVVMYLTEEHMRKDPDSVAKWGEVARASRS